MKTPPPPATALNTKRRACGLLKWIWHDLAIFTSKQILLRSPKVQKSLALFWYASFTILFFTFPVYPHKVKMVVQSWRSLRTPSTNKNRIRPCKLKTQPFGGKLQGMSWCGWWSSVPTRTIPPHSKKTPRILKPIILPPTKWGMQHLFSINWIISESQTKHLQVSRNRYPPWNYHSPWKIGRPPKRKLVLKNRSVSSSRLNFGRVSPKYELFTKKCVCFKRPSFSQIHHLRLATESHRRSGTRRWGNISNICSFSPADWLIDDGRNSWLHKQNQTTVDLGVSKNSGFSPPIIHFHKAFPLLSPSILGYPYCWKPPISKFTQNIDKINNFTMLRKYFGERFRGGRKSLEIGGCFES